MIGLIIPSGRHRNKFHESFLFQRYASSDIEASEEVCTPSNPQSPSDPLTHYNNRKHSYGTERYCSEIQDDDFELSFSPVSELIHGHGECSEFDESEIKAENGDVRVQVLLHQPSTDTLGSPVRPESYKLNNESTCPIGCDKENKNGNDLVISNIMSIDNEAKT